MAGLTDLAAKATLDWVTGKTTPATVATRYAALYTAVGTDAGTGFTEISGNGYARQDATTPMAAASGSAPSSAATSSSITFPTSTGDQTGAGVSPVIAFGILNHISTATGATTLLDWDYLGNFSWLPCTVSSASPGVFTAKAHGYANGDCVVFSTEYGGTAPSTSAGVTTGLLYVANVSTDTFTVVSGGSFTNAILGGGTAVNTSSTGSGMVRKVSPQLVPNNTALTISTLTLTQA